MVTRTSERFYLNSDMDGMTIRDIRKMIKDYPENARIVVCEEPVYSFGGWTDGVEEYFVFEWEE